MGLGEIQKIVQGLVVFLASDASAYIVQVAVIPSRWRIYG